MAEIERNAKVKDIFIGFEDHGIFTMWVFLEWDSGVQGFGGYGLDDWDEKAKKRIAITGAGLEFIKRILQICDVDEIQKAKGCPVRMRGDMTKVHAIGHYLKDDWFYPAEVFGKELRGVKDADKAE